MEGEEPGIELCETVQENDAYEYLCRLQEAKRWMESVLKEKLPPLIELEENLRNGVYLARIANFMTPEEVPLSRIYDIFQHRYRACGLQFKHTDNINYWIKALNAVNFPKIFHPETMDIYDKKNMPKVIYCIHALSRHLFKLGMASSIHDLYGKVKFNKVEIDTACIELKKYGSKIPSFEKINKILINESNCDQTAMHSFVIRTNEAISNKSNEELLKCLCDPAAELVHVVIPENIDDYMSSFAAAKEEKCLIAQNRCQRKNHGPDLYDDLLNQSEIEGYIRSTNCDCLWKEIQIYIKSNSKEKVKSIVSEISVLDLKDFNLDNIDTYVDLFLNLDTEKLKSPMKNRSSREAMENIIRNGNRMSKERKQVADALIEIKKAVKTKNRNSLLKALRVSALKLASKVSEENINLYFQELENLLMSSGGLNYNDLKSVIENVDVKNSNVSSGLKIEELLQKSHIEQPSFPSIPYDNLNDYNCKKTFSMSDVEKWLTLLQARTRGFLLRRKLKFPRKIHTQNSRLKRKRERLSNDFQHPLNIDHFLTHVDKVIKIQAAWRGYSVRKLIKVPSVSADFPKFLCLRQMAHLRKITDYDYSEQLKVQNLRSSVVETIKRNQELACKLDEMDTKIGLLVHNKMLIHNIDIEGKRLQNGITNKHQSKGIKTFNKEKKTLLDGYRQLFYMLQTDPTYLTRLITRMPEKSSQIIQSCVLSLFNYGSSPRDAYLLLRLFRSALDEEVKCKFQKPMDAIKGNSVVLRLALGFSRQYEGYNPLRDILGLFIEDVLKEQTFIDTNPVDIYRRWVNKMEMETGKTCTLPCTVTQAEALSYPQVSTQLMHNIEVLKTWVKAFLERIIASSNKFPYALRFIAKILSKALIETFPKEPEKDIMKIIGNLVFYQYINSALVAPDAFYIISLPPDRHLKLEQRRNLTSIAKILQFASWKKRFGIESQHLICMNSFILSCHEEMKRFCKKCCEVEDLDEHFNMSKYSEAALIEKPKVYVTFEEICECHKILVEERKHISSDPFDPIQEVLDALGEPPSVADLVGFSPKDVISSRIGKTQVCLELDNKFQLPPEDPTEAEKLFTRTKELIIKRIHSLKGRSLKESVDKEEHSDIASNLMKLELSGMVKTSDDYNAIIQAIINDITQRERHKKNLIKEIRSLNLAEERLFEKKKYYQDQLCYYEQYLNTCLASLTRPTKKSENKIRFLKYSANQLIEKGIVISLEGVPPSHIKNVRFEITSTEINGVYTIRGCFMGVEIEKINIDVQDLLQHQFEGRSTMDLFGNAKINVNLLLHLLNKKFHNHS